MPADRGHLGALLLEGVRTRLELGATELAEERLRIVRQLLAASWVLLCGAAGLVLAVLALAWWVGPERALPVLSGSAALLLLAAALGVVHWQRISRCRPPLLQHTLEQLRADVAALAPRSEAP